MSTKFSTRPGGGRAPTHGATPMFGNRPFPIPFRVCASAQDSIATAMAYLGQPTMDRTVQSVSIFCDTHGARPLFVNRSFTIPFRVCTSAQDSIDATMTYLGQHTMDRTVQSVVIFRTHAKKW